MDTLMSLDINSNFTEIIKQNMHLFNSFINVYLFGSILNIEKESNDIDILLIYSVYSNKIIDDLNSIKYILESKTNLSIDLTVLSIDEKRETMFLEKLNTKYLKLK